MNAAITSRAGGRPRMVPQRTSSRSTLLLFETLEDRRLLSASWSTDDIYFFPGGGTVNGMAADPQGNVYESGQDATTSPTSLFVREKAKGSTSWNTIYESPGSVLYTGNLASDPAGNIFLAGSVSGHLIVREKPAGQDSFSVVVDDLPGGSFYGLGADSAGNLYESAAATITTTTTSHGKTSTTSTSERLVRQIVPDASAPGGYTARNIYQGTTYLPMKVMAIDSGPSAGVYFASAGNGDWNVVKGTRASNGAWTWNQVDRFDYDPSFTYTGTFDPGNSANSLAADAAGNLYVAGGALKRTITGYTTVNNKQVPVYGYTGHWIVRKSTDGGASWATIDDFSPSQGAVAGPMAIDQAGNIYVAGSASEAVVRESTDGGKTWSNIDEFRGYAYGWAAFTIAADGNLYAAGKAGGGSTQSAVVRSTAAVPLTASMSPFARSSATGIGTTTLFFSRAVTGLDASDLTLTQPDGTVVNLADSGATFTSKDGGDGLIYLLSLPPALTEATGSYTLSLNAIGSDIFDANGMSLQNNPVLSWTRIG